MMFATFFWQIFLLNFLLTDLFIKEDPIYS